MADSRMNILVVDDFSTMRRIIKNILRQLGYINILEADDGTGAMRCCAAQRATS
jgi:two-component system chemotaxis response regulator CheY